jgi:plasmid stabilization system protein ParE
MPETRQSVERQLSKKHRLLAILEEQIAGYTELEAPVSKLAERDQLREEVARLQALLESGNAIRATISSDISEQLDVRSALAEEGTMSEQEKAGDVIRATISGDVSGQVAVGKGITQTQTIGAAPPEVTEADLAELRQVLVGLKAKVAAEAPPDKKVAALERVAELEEAVTAKEPDLPTMEYVKGWFAKNLPGLAGAVTSVVVHPIVGKLVEAAGDALAAEFRRRF